MGRCYDVGFLHPWHAGSELIQDSLRRQDISAHNIDYVEYVSSHIALSKGFNYLCHVNVEEWLIM